MHTGVLLTWRFACVGCGSRLQAVRQISPTKEQLGNVATRTDGFNSAKERARVQELAELSVAKRQVLATAESCTGGMIASALTNLPGSSDWFECGFVTYSNAAKENMLGVDSSTLATSGAVSEATVTEMANGAIANSNATIACAVSGVAGPGGGTAEKPVGTVWIAWAGANGAQAQHFQFAGDRDDVRRLTVLEAIEGMIRCINSVAS